MTDPTLADLATGVLVDTALKSSLVLGVGAGASRLVGSATQRHAVWAATLAVLPLLPVLAVGRGVGVALELDGLLTLYGMGVVGFSVPLLRGLLSLWSLGRSGVEGPDGVLTSPRLASPVTWGWLRPRIAFPPQASCWPEGELEAALAHERAHVARRDWLVHVLAWMVCIGLWFHPGVWWVRRQLVREAEHAADDHVLAGGVRPSDYAALLLRLGTRTPPVALGAGSLVGLRVHAVLDERRRSRRRWPVFLTAAVVSLATGAQVGAFAFWEPPPPEVLGCLPADAVEAVTPSAGPDGMWSPSQQHSRR